MSGIFVPPRRPGAFAAGIAPMLGFLGVNFYKNFRPRGDDDFVDRLNYYYTPILLGICAVIVSAKQYVGKPIQCWVPQQFSSSMEEYIENYCWVQNTYWLPMYRNIPDDHERRDDEQIGYYQWVPFILVTEALLFSLPGLIWRLTNWQTGLNVHRLICLGVEVECQELDEKSRGVSVIVSTLAAVLDLHSSWEADRMDGLNCSLWAKFHRYNGCYVTLIYLCVKGLYTLNVVLQFFLLNAFLKSGAYAFYGVQVMGDLLGGREWGESGHFPRVTLCDFEVRYLGNLNRYTVQCALMVNLFNEKVFAFIWVWMVVLVTVTAASLLFWFFNAAFAAQRIAFVMKFLRIAALQYRQAKTEEAYRRRKAFYTAPGYVFDAFVEEHLRMDGVFILRLLANHAGDVVAMEVTKRLWEQYREAQLLPEFESTEPLKCSEKTVILEDMEGSSVALVHANQSVTC